MITKKLHFYFQFFLHFYIDFNSFSQWVFNNYDSDIDDLEEFIETCDFDKKGVFERMFENYRCIKSSLDNLNGYDDFYYEDVETREKHYDDNENYYHINEEWEEYFSDYLLKNMPEEYYQYIVDYEISKPII